MLFRSALTNILRTHQNLDKETLRPKMVKYSTLDFRSRLKKRLSFGQKNSAKYLQDYNKVSKSLHQKNICTIMCIRNAVLLSEQTRLDWEKMLAMQSYITVPTSNIRQAFYILCSWQVKRKYNTERLLH